MKVVSKHVQCTGAGVSSLVALPETTAAGSHPPIPKLSRAPRSSPPSPELVSWLSESWEAGRESGGAWVYLSLRRPKGTWAELVGSCFTHCLELFLQESEARRAVCRPVPLARKQSTGL